jgi:hypothetical protein
LKDNSNDKTPSTPEDDYYFENGLMVFTKAYHLRRGYCCQSGCRHCPYGFKKKKNNETEADK